MEIKRVKEESYESISAYLDILMSLVSRFDNLCFVDHDGKRYMVGVGDEKIVYVENDEGNLNPYYIDDSNPLVEKYGTEEFDHEIIIESDLREVIRKNKLTGNAERLSYLPRIDNYPRDIIDYIQYIDSLEATVLHKYDVTNRCNERDAFNFCACHEPDLIQVTVLKQLLWHYYPKTYDYCLGLDDDFYYQPLIKIKDLLIGSKKYRFFSKYFIQELSKKGFSANIPRELSSLALDTEETHKSLKLIGDEYKNFIKRG